MLKEMQKAAFSYKDKSSLPPRHGCDNIKIGNFYVNSTLLAGVCSLHCNLFFNITAKVANSKTAVTRWF
jgi:hypothetical protein